MITFNHQMKSKSFRTHAIGNVIPAKAGTSVRIPGTRKYLRLNLRQLQEIPAFARMTLQTFNLVFELKRQLEGVANKVVEPRCGSENPDRFFNKL